MISILSATATGCLKKKMLVNLFFRGKYFFPRFLIFISARILISATNSRLWRKTGGGGGGGGWVGGEESGGRIRPPVGSRGKAPGRGLGATPPEAEGFFSMSSQKTAFWSMKIRYLQVSKLYV